MREVGESEDAFKVATPWLGRVFVDLTNKTLEFGVELGGFAAGFWCPAFEEGFHQRHVKMCLAGFVLAGYVYCCCHVSTILPFLEIKVHESGSGKVCRIDLLLPCVNNAAGSAESTLTTGGATDDSLEAKAVFEQIRDAAHDMGVGLAGEFPLVLALRHRRPHPRGL